jgi:hypothetical protein
VNNGPTGWRRTLAWLKPWHREHYVLTAPYTPLECAERLRPRVASAWLPRWPARQRIFAGSVSAQGFCLRDRRSNYFPIEAQGTWTPTGQGAEIALTLTTSWVSFFWQMLFFAVFVAYIHQSGFLSPEPRAGDSIHSTTPWGYLRSSCSSMCCPSRWAGSSPPAPRAHRGGAERGTGVASVNNDKAQLW